MGNSRQERSSTMRSQTSSKLTMQTTPLERQTINARGAATDQGIRSTFRHLSPFRYPGGKTWLIPRVRPWLSKLGKNGVRLAEPFAGSGIVGLTGLFEELVDHITLVELDPNIAAVWQTLLNGEAPWLATRIEQFAIEYDAVLNELRASPSSLKQLAFQTILRNRVQRGGIIAPGAGLLKNGERGRGIASRWYPQTLKKRITAIAAKRDAITFVHGDGLNFVERCGNRRDIALFIDPPYTIAGKRLYEFANIDHERLFALVSRLTCDFLMTYDNSEEIRRLAAQFNLGVVSVQMKNTHHQPRTELLISKDFSWLEHL